MLTLVLGGTRSGKSRYAEQCASASKKSVIYVATATADDEEMCQRIERHRNYRPAHWHTVEEPVCLADTIHQYLDEGHFILVECLTLWLNNILFDSQGQLQESVFKKQSDALIKMLTTIPGNIALVSNEVGLGVVAMDKNTRRFVDEAGFLHQKIAKLSDRVVFLTAGIPRIIK